MMVGNSKKKSIPKQDYDSWLKIHRICRGLWKKQQKQSAGDSAWGVCAIRAQKMPKRNKQHDWDPNGEPDPERNFLQTCRYHMKNKQKHTYGLKHRWLHTNNTLPLANKALSCTGCQGGRCCCECLAVCLLASGWHPPGMVRHVVLSSRQPD